MIVYKATFPNGKLYIGITKFKLSDRIRGHKCSAFTRKSKNPVHCAIRKYGWENVKWEIIYTANNYDEILEKEIELIASENTLVPKGYNITKGGQGTLGSRHCLGMKRSQEVRNKNKIVGMRTAKKCVLVNCLKKEFKIFDSIADLARYANIGYDQAKVAMRIESGNYYHYRILKLENFNENDPNLFNQKIAHNALEFTISNGIDFKQLKSINDLRRFLNISERQARNIFYKNKQINGWRKI